MMKIYAEYNYLNCEYVFRTPIFLMEPEDLIRKVLDTADGLIDKIHVMLAEPLSVWNHKG